MNQGENSVLGLVELAENHDVADLHSAASFSVLRDAFYDRLKHWVRTKDQWRSLSHNRVCVVLKDITSEGELDLAALKLGRVFRDPHFHRGIAMPFLVSAGFAPFRDGGRDMSVAMRQANIALNHAKKSHHLYEVYSGNGNGDDSAEEAMLMRMESALETGQFQLYFQPQVHAGYQTLIGAEALLRWHTPEQEIVEPEEFIDLAERNEIIKPLTWWALKSAVARLARWPEQMSIALNISPVLLLDNDLESVLHDALDIYSVKPERLNLEVTEKIMVEQQDLMRSQLQRLREIGVKLSIDDFGTGYSSLAYFRDLPVDEIKIDQSFVRNMLHSERDHAIVEAVIDLAHNFSLRVVAEGVETMAIADRLSRLRCDILQGYVFDRPLPVEQFETHYKLD